MIAASPTIWGVHFLLSYVTAAIWCAKVGGSLEEVRMLIAVYTAAALGGIGYFGARGLMRQGRSEAEIPHEEDLPEDRYGFMGFATLLLSALSAVATIYVALTAVFVESCF